ncbi:MAG: NAD-dependent epimerase/dehydratase family protein [Planctomycetes bacterium]|nr:NAD-dependent epimerase/dehydratase family protein [Planctomycetota bacterium]
MTSALVTGATGFVGSHLADLLLDRGWRVFCTVRRTSKLRWLDGKPVERIDADLRLPLELPEVDVVFHVAGVVRGETVEDYRRGNWLASKHMIEAARCRRFVHVSSIAAVGPGCVNEGSPCRPVSDYGRSKLEGEREVWKHRDRVPITILRPPVVYGARDEGLLEMYRALAGGLRPEVGRGKRISIVHVRDLVEGMLAAAEHEAAAGEIFCLANADTYGMAEMMEMILDAIGRRRALRLSIPDRVVRFLAGVAEDAGRFVGRVPMFNRDKAAEMTQPAWVCSAAKAERLLGWRARVPIREGLREMLEWYAREGLLTFDLRKAGC